MLVLKNSPGITVDVMMTTILLSDLLLDLSNMLALMTGTADVLVDYFLYYLWLEGLSDLYTTLHIPTLDQQLQNNKHIPSTHSSNNCSFLPFRILPCTALGNFETNGATSQIEPCCFLSIFLSSDFGDS